MTKYVCLLVAFLMGIALMATAHSHDAVHGAWAEKQRNRQKMQCCDGKDYVRLSDEDWGIKGQKYWVRLFGKQYDVPDEALLDNSGAPNPTGSALVWYVVAEYGEGIFIRCFTPGVEA